MTELPPGLARLRVIETYLVLQLGQVREAIRRAEEAERQRSEREPRPRQPVADEGRKRQRQSESDARAGGRADDSAGPGRTSSGTKWWHIEPAIQSGPNAHPAYLHKGDCARCNRQGRLGFTRDEARAALADEQDGVPTIQPCPVCRPHLALA